jgi:hypothetical protein
MGSIVGVAALIFFAFHIYKKRRYMLVDLANKQSIFFLADKPSRDELAKFLQDMYSAR